MAFFSSTLFGIKPIPVEIEIDLSSGLPFFQIVGLPDAILRESKTRVKSAILQSGFDFPYDQRVVLNLAPSKIKKEGSGSELGLACRILAASEQIALPEGHVLFIGELGLDGSVRAVPETKMLAFAALEPYAAHRKFDFVVTSREDLPRLNFLNIPTVGVGHLSELKGNIWWESAQRGKNETKLTGFVNGFEKLRFSSFWARHLEIAAVGEHHYLLCGPPGCGKTFFAESLKLLRENFLCKENVAEDLLDVFFNRASGDLPWGAPHHSATSAGLVGGGSPPKPGALTRAHGGILFLDELLEFSAGSLDALREPLEKGYVEIFRASHYLQFPSSFQLIGATNPCRCGFWKSLYQSCRCSTISRKIYQTRLSGPLLDRFDVKLMINSSQDEKVEVSGKEILRIVRSALKRKDSGVAWSKGSKDFLDLELKRRRLSLRARSKIEKVCQTLCLLEGQDSVAEDSILEACNFQTLDGLDFEQ